MTSDSLPPDVLAEIEADVKRYHEQRINRAIKDRSRDARIIEGLKLRKKQLQDEVDKLRRRFGLKSKYDWCNDDPVPPDWPESSEAA